MPQQLELKVSIQVPVLPFGTFQYHIVHQTLEEAEKVKGEPQDQKPLPYFLPTGTGDLQSPVTYWTAAG